MIYPIEITTPGKPGELRNQIQGLVLAREWEFESPLRHHLELQESSKKPAKLTPWRAFYFLRFQKNRLYSKDGGGNPYPHRSSLVLQRKFLF